MTNTLKNFFKLGIGVTEESTVDISRYGAVRVDPERLVTSDEVQRQIATLDKLIKDGTVAIETTRKS